jgi:hypothetical protein
MKIHDEHGVEYVYRNVKCKNIKISLMLVLKIVFVTYEN